MREGNVLVKFSSLKSDPKKRQIHSIIKSPTGDITVFEPTKEDIEKIMELQEFVISLNKDSKKDDNTLDISGMTIIKKVVPLITDLDLNGLSDEEIQDVINHPNLAMMELNQILSSIITSIYKMVILSYANELQTNDVSLETMKLNHNTIGQFVTQAATTDKGRELVTELMNEANKADSIRKANMVKESTKSTNRGENVTDFLSTNSSREVGKQPDSYQDKVFKDKVEGRYDDLDVD